MQAPQNHPDNLPFGFDPTRQQLGVPTVAPRFASAEVPSAASLGAQQALPQGAQQETAQVLRGIVEVDPKDLIPLESRPMVVSGGEEVDSDAETVISGKPF